MTPADALLIPLLLDIADSHDEVLAVLREIMLASGGIHEKGCAAASDSLETCGCRYKAFNNRARMVMEKALEVALCR